jgi:hypothetical protein
MKSITVLLHGGDVGLVVQYLMRESVTCLKTSASRTATPVLLANTIVFQYRRCFSFGASSCLGPIWFLVTSTVSMSLELIRSRFYSVALCIILVLCG